MSKHDKFILAPMSKILKEVVLASAGIGSGIETYPLCDYIMQSVFLKMTGCQEQKMKCIAWEIATNDFEYRRRLLNDEDKLGEYSAYTAKNKIYKSLCKQVEGFSPNFNFKALEIKERVKQNSFDLVIDVFGGTNLAVWKNEMFNEFSRSKVIRDNQYLKGAELLESILIEEYKTLYNQRNRIAHNTVSYQQNLPDFSVLREEKDCSRNYFLWFSILLLIDNIFIEVYKIYKDAIEKQVL